MEHADNERRTGLDRREFITLGIGALVIGALPLSSLRHRQPLFRRSIPVMGTIAEIAVANRDRAVAQAAIDDAIGVLRWTDAALSRFRADSEISSINRQAGRDAVEVSRETADLVASALLWARLSDGGFDPSLARASELWDVTSRIVPPTRDQVVRFAGRRMYESIEVRTIADKQTVAIANRDAALDLGGIGKGHGVDRAVAALRRHGIEHALVNAGGDLYALGESPEGRPWRVGLRSPIDPERIVRTLEVSDRGVATSGDYLQYFEYRGRRYHHILDPVTGEPVSRTSTSVTVIAESCTAADAGATAAFGLPGAEAERLLQLAAPGSSLVRIG